MNPETETQRAQREAKLKQLCEEMGLVVSGSIVVAPLGNPVAVDASAADLGNLPAVLMYLAHQQGIELGRKQVREEMNRLLSA